MNTKRHKEILSNIDKMIERYKIKEVSLKHKDFEEIWQPLPENVKKRFPDEVSYRAITIKRIKPSCLFFKSNP